MKASIIRIALAIAVVLGVTTGRALSQGEMREEMKQESAEQISQLRIAQLTVKSVDPKQHKVTFEAKVSPEANYRSGEGEPIRIDELKPGDEVRAAFNPNTGEVVQVDVTTAKEKEKTKSE